MQELLHKHVDVVKIFITLSEGTTYVNNVLYVKLIGHEG